MVSIAAYKNLGKKSKYRNKKINGYDSIKEYRRACVLKDMEKLGLITHLKEQQSFVLLESFTDNQGNKERGITYKMDFTYFDTHKNYLVAEDVKGFRTSVYTMKRKMFKKLYPQYVFIES